MNIAKITFEHHQDHEPLGIGEVRPRMSWIVRTSLNNWQQAGYEIELYGPDGQLRERTCQVETGQSVLVEWPFSPLSARQRVEVRVRVWGTGGSISEWSKLYQVEVGLLAPADWTAQFITPDRDSDEDSAQPRPTPLLRKEFDIHSGFTQARLYITALGIYEVQLNGSPVGDHILSPGWTSYHNRLR